ncbi:unnamed protein product [Schistosoma mattheei]|uniref:Uncharacterized protein n=1 Tax=Schistosoma mattheei TaxID=31246 RepID=A0A183PC71_9TREM|nr:unnamed protein product [Schistosoma mattheei]
MVVVGSQQETLDPGFVPLGTRQQSVPVILRELVLLGGFNPLSPSFAAEDFVRTLKIDIDSIAASTFNKQESGVDMFLLRYRNVKHSATKEIPSELLSGRILLLSMRCLESTEVKYYRGNDLRLFTEIVVKNVGESVVIQSAHPTQCRTDTE